MILTSVKMQQIIIGKNYFDEWYMPLLRFGKGKSNEFKMPIYIKGENQNNINLCHAELMEYKGKTKDELILCHDKIVLKYNEYVGILGKTDK
jgi:hypothetical protein